MKVNETFVSISGEISVGRLAYFIRTSGCCLRCIFCDSKHSWDEGHDVQINELVENAKHFPMVVITGGEPLLQKEELNKLITKLKKTKPSIRIEIETNGTIPPTRMTDLGGVIFNVSVKLKNSGNEYNKRINPQAINWLNKFGANFKFVVDTKDDVDEINMLVQEFGIKKFNVFLMPMGATREEQWNKTEEVLELAKFNGYNFTPRFHTLLWGNERGK